MAKFGAGDVVVVPFGKKIRMTVKDGAHNHAVVDMELDEAKTVAEAFGFAIDALPDQVAELEQQEAEKRDETAKTHAVAAGKDPDEVKPEPKADAPAPKPANKPAAKPKPTPVQRGAKKPAAPAKK